MRKNGKVVFGDSLPEMVAARDNLRMVLPGCLLLELLDARLARLRLEPPILSPWTA
jgi:hypothetical protein